MKTFTSTTRLLIVLLMALVTYGYSPDRPMNNLLQSIHSNAKNNASPDDRPDKPQRECEHLCNEKHGCPPECVYYIDPWSFDSIPTSLKKRSTGIDGFSFDDYLFLRWLGRDMKRHRLL